MNEKESNSKGMSQMSEIKPNEKSGVCTFCGNKNVIESRIVTCVYNVSVEAYADSKKQMSTRKSSDEKFDPIEWTISMCPSCIVAKAKAVFWEHALLALGIGLAGWAMVLFFVPWLRREILTDLIHQPAFHTMFNIFLYIAWGLGILSAIVGPIAFLLGIITYIITNLMGRYKIEEIKEHEIKDAFIKAGKTILADLKLQKDASKFKHFPLPKLPTDEDILKMYPDQYVEYTKEIKILDS